MLLITARCIIHSNQSRTVAPMPAATLSNNNIISFSLHFNTEQQTINGYFMYMQACVAHQINKKKINKTETPTKRPI